MTAYLDNSATTKTFEKVNKAMLEMLENNYGNPSSLHKMGMEAENKLNWAREVIASYFRCAPKNIYFTSGGTESNNQAVSGYLLRNPRAGRKIITTAVEHPSVLNIFKHLENMGYETVYIDVDRSGRLDYDALSEAVDENTALVSVMQVNNETGAVFDIGRIKELINRKNKNTVLHSDFVQSFLKLDYVKGADLISFSSHKVNGPKGVGGLYVRDGLLMSPLLHGGGQEKGLRNGTENAPGIYGFGVAVREHLDNYSPRKIAELRDRLYEKLKDIPDILVNTDFEEQNAPHILNISFLGLRSEIVLHTLEQFGVYVSSGSACSSHGTGHRKVLEKMGRSKAEADSAIRMSLSALTTEEEIDYAAKTINREIGILRKRLK